MEPAISGWLQNQEGGGKGRDEALTGPRENQEPSPGCVQRPDPLDPRQQYLCHHVTVPLYWI